MLPGLFEKHCLQGYLAYRKNPPLPGPPEEPRHGPTVGSCGVGGSYERGTPVMVPFGFGVWRLASEGQGSGFGVQGYLAHKNQPPPRNLQ